MPDAGWRLRGDCCGAAYADMAADLANNARDATSPMAFQQWIGKFKDRPGNSCILTPRVRYLALGALP
jgi:hypothetical protein